MSDEKCDCKLCALNLPKEVIAEFVSKVFEVEALMVTEETHVTDFGWGDDERTRCKDIYGLDLPERFGEDDGYLWQVLRRLA